MPQTKLFSFSNVYNQNTLNYNCFNVKTRAIQTLREVEQQHTLAIAVKAEGDCNQRQIWP